MPAKTSSEARAAILALHGIGLTSRRIVDALKKQNYVVSKSTVTSVIRDLKNAEAGIVKPPRKIPPQNMPTVRTKELIAKVKKELGKSTPLTKRQIAKKYDVSVNTINRVIKMDLKGEEATPTLSKRITAEESSEEMEVEDDEVEVEDDEVEVEASQRAQRRERKKREKKSKSSKSSSKIKSSKKKSLKTKIPKVRRRKDSAEREPETELLEPHREISEDE